MSFSANVNVMLKDGIADPQGQTIERALPALGFKGVGSVRVGKRITLEVDSPDRETAHRQITNMCEKLLANPVIESYEVTIE
jgi:phosphoribosylformylglycinamidine synthase subunit PurS